jgi:hypothetical protein
MIIQQWHPAADAFPLMQGDEFQKFVDDIRAHGVRKPIEVYDGERWPEFKGLGIDGRNRQRACIELKLEPPVRLLSDVDIGESLTSYIASVNVSRRHLTSSQAAIVALELEKQFAVENAAKMAAGQAKGNKVSAAVRSGDDEICSLQIFAGSKISENSHNSDETDQQSSYSRQQAAALAGTNRQYVSDAKIIEKESASLVNLVRNGDLSIPQAKAALKQRPAHNEAFAALEAGQIDFDEFREWCWLKGEHIDLWNQFQLGALTIANALAEAKERKAAKKKANDAVLAEALAAASARSRVEAAYKELGDSATVNQIADRAGVRRDVAEEIILGIPDDSGDRKAEPIVPRGEEIGAGPDGEYLYRARRGEATDRLQRPLSPELASIFSDLPEFDALIAALAQCQTRIGKLARRQAAARVDAARLVEQLRAAEETLREQAPFCVCPSCSGQAANCPTCENTGFISEGTFARLNQDLQEIAHGYVGPASSLPEQMVTRAG